MADVFSRQKRSEIMSRIKGRGNRATELRLVSLFKTYGIKGWRRSAPVFGKPDFVFPSLRIAVFVDGCFWHGCPIHGSVPGSNRDFWEKKLSRNKSRDRLVNKKLHDLGWKSVRVWQHELRRPEKVARRLERLLEPPERTGAR
jgi:DNA mismatch endonuclease, patch repair protein